MTNEVVKYHNDLNTVAMRKWTAEEMNFFFAIIAKAKESGTGRLIFGTDDLKELASSSRKYRWEETITNASKKIGQMTYFEQSERKFRVMTLFEIFEVDLENRSVMIKVSSNFDYILNKLEAQFTMYELEEFTCIRSTYAKTAYRLLKQWRTVGRKEFKVDDFKRILDMPDSYQSSHIDRLVLKPILKELSPYFENLKVKKIKSNKRGNPVLGYEFIWKKEIIKPSSSNQYNKSMPDWSVASVDEDVAQEYNHFFKKFSNIAKSTKATIVKYADTFDSSERFKMLNFAYYLYNKNEGQKPSYITAIVREWSSMGIKTLVDAKQFYENNYHIENKGTTLNQSNIPGWSNPQYRNMTTEVEQAELDKKRQELLKKLK